jgi:sulfate adenylyltransferase subunit 2
MSVRTPPSAPHPDYVAPGSPSLSALGLDEPGVWDTARAIDRLQARGAAGSQRTAERRLHQLGLLPPALDLEALRDEGSEPLNPVLLDWALANARRRRQLVLLIQVHRAPDGSDQIHANDLRGARYWVRLPDPGAGLLAGLRQALSALQQHLGKPIMVVGHAELAGCLRSDPPLPDSVVSSPHVYAPRLDDAVLQSRPRRALSPHLRRLEAESLFILREAVAEAERPVMLYSVGKDSAVMLHLARKAFYPAVPPFPLLHVDTRWKFRQMYLFRNRMARELGMELIVHINPDAIARDINPFDHGSALHTEITKTEGLRQALDRHRFDMVFGGARRDEEKSRAKERVFSFRTASHRWDPKRQRPELWSLYNTRISRGESIRVFPLSNWTELDVWQYIACESIPVVPLYFAHQRPVVVRDGLILAIDDGRFRLLPDERIVEKRVRFRTLGCYPLSGAVESQAADVDGIVAELLAARTSERQGRAIDADSAASMEKKKREGYF